MIVTRIIVPPTVASVTFTLLNHVTLNVGQRIVIGGRCYEVTGQTLDGLVCREETPVRVLASLTPNKKTQPPHWAKYNDWRKKAKR